MTNISGLLEAYATRSGVAEIGVMTHRDLDYQLRGFIASKYVEFMAHDGEASAGPGEFVIEGKSGQLFKAGRMDGWKITFGDSPKETTTGPAPKADVDPTIVPGAPVIKETSAVSDGLSPEVAMAVVAAATTTGNPEDPFEIGGPDDVSGPLGDDFAAAMEAATAAVPDVTPMTEEEAGAPE